MEGGIEKCMQNVSLIPERKRPLGRPTLKMNLEAYNDVGGIQLGQDKAH
jgi:hypothetical protein